MELRYDVDYMRNVYCVRVGSVYLFQFIMITG
jgi:hypothetical protein